MDTAKAYGRMEEANRIIEDFPVKKYAIYTILFLLEIALCFAVLYAKQLDFSVQGGYIGLKTGDLNRLQRVIYVQFPLFPRSTTHTIQPIRQATGNSRLSLPMM